MCAPLPAAHAAARYARHLPERTLLYALVQAHYPDFIARLEAEDRPLPEYVREEFETYLRCGVLEHGFLRVVCEQCRAERLVAFSCKKRGFCPSCGARRMAESARHLVEEVFGPRPVRQWVLSFPYPLRFLFASKPEAIGPVLGIVHRVIAGWLADQAGVDHASAQCGAVTLIQRFGSALKRFDYIVSNPPFKMDFSDFRDDLDSKENQLRFFAGIPKVKAKAREKMEIYQLFLQHIIFSLKPDGKAAVVVPTGFITAQSGIDKGIREHLVKNKMLAGVVSMPSNIFATTGTNVSILFIDASNKEKVVLIDASNLGAKVKDGKNQKTVLTEEEEQRICEVFNNKWSEEDFSVVVSYDDIAGKNYSFSAGQYFDVKIEYADMTPEQFAEKMKGFTDNLESLFSQSLELEAEIKMQMAGLKYE
ncbi:N-6 DNA methylase [Escherichia coli]|nr:N-6 DNA methylase [Escherichia coli]